MKKLLIFFTSITLLFGIYSVASSISQINETPQQDSYVWICTGSKAYAYHSSACCSGLRNCRDRIIRVIEKDAVEEMVAATKGGTIDIVGCDYMKDFLSGKTTYHRENYAETCRENLYRCLNYDIATVLWKLLIRRSLFDNFHISPINIGEDYIMSIKLFYYASSFSILRKAFYHYVQYNQNRLSFQLLCSINDHIKCVNEVERFFRDNKMYDGVVEHQLLLRKFNIKSNFILNRKLFNPDVFINIFPESKGIWKEMNYSKKERFEFWLAEHNFLLLLNLLKK